MKSAVALTFYYSLAVVSASVIFRENWPQVKEKCWEHYGCFNTEAPWRSFNRPLGDLPEDPHVVGTRFLLFTRSNKYEDFELLPDNEAILGHSPYDQSKRTIFLVHGFTDSYLTEWMVQAKNAFLEKEDVNVIAVDWAPGASRSYLRATNNARMVGAQMTRFIKFLEAKASLELGSVRMVGHSVGAHAASYTGDAFWGAIGQITALDPTDQYFGGTPELVRLDPADARDVQVIHTHGDILSGMGMRQAVGHVDLYPNGGDSQPGCKDLLGSLIGAIENLLRWDFDGAIGEFVCSHVRASDYYVESIKSQCPFVAHKCDSYGEYNNGNCKSSCTEDGSCAVLGYGSEKHPKSKGNYYLNTDAGKSFCLQSVQFDTSVKTNQAPTTGKVTVSYTYEGEVSPKYVIFDGKMTGGQILSQWADVPSRILADPNQRPQLYVRYDRGGFFQPRQLHLEASTVTVVDEDFQLKSLRFPAATLETNTETLLHPE